MRRRLGSAVPIFLIALLAQFWAPIAVCSAMPAAIGATLSEPDCSHVGEAVDSEGSSLPNGQHACCPICAPSHSACAAFVSAFVATLLAPAAPRRRIASNLGRSTPPAQWIGLTARPRGPPAIS